MEILLILLCGFGITFFLQHKAYPLLSKVKFFERMLNCTYCTAIHGGWIAYILFKWSTFHKLALPVLVTNFIVYAFAGGAFTYALDAVTSYWEKE